MIPGRSTLRPTVITVDLDRLHANFQELRGRVASAKVMAVVKANAYGHGLVPCARTLEKAGADFLGVALVEEGVKLRLAGITLPILVFGGIFGEQVDVYLDHGLDLTASSVAKLEAIEERAKARNIRARVHVKIDTGMGRIGVRPESARSVLEAIGRASHCDFVGIFTHFATADEADDSFTEQQLERFLDAIDCIPSLGLAPPLRHAANSAALLRYPDTHLDMVRPGIALFGVNPVPAAGVRLHPVMTVGSRVVYFKVVLPGGSVSYGRTWEAAEPTRVATIPVGYGDGYPRALSSRADVLIRGRRCPIVGRVCMDQVMVNVGAGEAYNGDEVILIGSQGGEQISVSELAEHAGTIPYEILTALNVRIPRRFVSGGQVVSEES